MLLIKVAVYIFIDVTNISLVNKDKYYNNPSKGIFDLGILIVNPNPDSVKKVHSINESLSGFGFGESCLNPISLAM